MTRSVRIAIIGSGFAGLGMACQLRRHGIDDFVVLERGSEVGGTWRDNTYPGAACDIRSDLYSFSFAPNPEWTRTYGQQAEILEYLRSVADNFDVRSRILFGQEVERADWSDEDARWTITTSAESIEAQILISGAGPLIEPVWPKVDGLSSFAGPAFHSARWDHEAGLAGARIAVIGTGASAIQFVPELQKVAGSVTIFQRTPAWIVPRSDRAVSRFRQAMFRQVPLAQRVSRAWIFVSAEARFLGFRWPAVGRVFRAVALRLMRSQVADPELRDKLTPRYRIGCKRVLVSSDFYPALAQPNVELVDQAVSRIDGTTVYSADGTARGFDVLIAATGFNATEPPMARFVRGQDGQLLADVWSPHMSALRGTTVAGFPNLFLLVGPNSVTGHNSVVYIIESQIAYVLRAIAAMDGAGANVMSTRQEAQDAYGSGIQAALASSVWTTGGCASYYLDSTGRNTALWPRSASAFRRSVRRFHPDEFTLA
jgi:cation diffusion facilitator CzcD-associated flavoprotein CzcO